MSLLAPATASGPLPALPPAVAETLQEVLAHVPHPPIRIESDADLCGDTLQSGVVNCDEADGTRERPYVISGWAIENDPEVGASALLVANTTKHLVVRDNLLLAGTGTAIRTVQLVNVQNLAFQSNLVRAGTESALHVAGLVADVYFTDAIAGNTFIAGSPEGRLTLVKLTGLQNAAITANRFTGTTESHYNIDALVVIASSTQPRLRDNVYAMSDGYGLSVQATQHLSSVDESFQQVRSSVRLVQSPSAQFSGLNASRVVVGLESVNSPQLTVRNSAFMDAYPCSPVCLTSTGIAVTNANLTLFATSISGFDTGVSFKATAPYFMTADCVNVVDNGDGIVVSDVGSTIITSSAIHQNALSGLRNLGTSTLQATTNWWGSASGPQHTTNPNGTGDRVIGKANVSAWLPEFPSCAPPTP